jgi:hypothetical protein
MTFYLRSEVYSKRSYFHRGIARQNDSRWILLLAYFLLSNRTYTLDFYTSRIAGLWFESLVLLTILFRCVRLFFRFFIFHTQFQLVSCSFSTLRWRAPFFKFWIFGFFFMESRDHPSEIPRKIWKRKKIWHAIWAREKISMFIGVTVLFKNQDHVSTSLLNTLHARII